MFDRGWFSKEKKREEEDDMAGGDERQQGMTAAAAAADQFPVGMRVLAVDDNLVCLKVLEALLRYCKYHATMVRDAETALRMLQAGNEQYDLVITDVRMPNMDGFRLLELIGLKMDIPVIMLSADEEEKSVMKGISSGACDYLVKPVKIKELKNIWQHVVRRRIPDPRVQPAEITEGEQSGAKKADKKKCSKRRMTNEVDANENKENKCLSTKKKPRVTWTRELHGRFLQAVNWMGIDNAVPKKIMEMMNVSYITRESVASHLQKYRIYMKKISSNMGTGRFNLFVDSSKRWNSHNTMHDLGSYGHHCEYVSSSSSSSLFPSINSPSSFGSHGMQLPTQAFHLSNPQSSLGMRPVVPGGSILKDARKLPSFILHANSFTNISNDTMLDDDGDEDEDDELTTYYDGNSYTNVLRNKLLEANKAIPSNSFENMPSGATMSLPVEKLPVQSTAVSVLVNQFPEKSPQLGNHHPVQVNYTLHGNDSHFQDIVGHSNRSWQAMVPTKLPDLDSNDGVYASLDTSHADLQKINQLARFTSSSGQIPVLRDQVPTLISNTSPMVCRDEPTQPFGIEDNTSSMNMLDKNSAFGGASSIISALPSHEIDNVLATTPMLNGEGSIGSFLWQEGIVDQQSLVDQLGYNNQVLNAPLDFRNQVHDDQLNYNIEDLDDQLQALDGQLNLCNQALDGQLNFNNQAPDDRLNFSNEAPGGWMNYNNNFHVGIDELDTGAYWDEILGNFQN